MSINGDIKRIVDALKGINDALDSIERKGLLVARNLSAEELAEMVTVKQRERN